MFYQRSVCKSLYPFLLVVLGLCSVSAVQAEGYDRLKNRWQSDHYLHVENGELQSGLIEPAWLSAQWTIEPAERRPFVRLRNRWKPDHYIHIEHGHVEAGPIDFNWWSAQWTIEPAERRPFVRLRNRWKPDHYIHIEHGHVEAGPIQRDWWSAQWAVESIGAMRHEVSVPYRFRNILSGKCLDVTNASREDHVIIQQYSCRSAGDSLLNAQLWTFRFFRSNRGFHMRSVLSGKCLDVTNASRKDRAKIQQYSCRSAGDSLLNAQLWRVKIVNGYEQYQNVLSGKCLDVTNASQEDHALIQQFSCRDGDDPLIDAQLWYVTER